MNAPELIEAPLFRDVEAALRFAFRYEYEQFERTALANMASGPSPEGRGLGGLDGAATCGMIGAQLATMPQLWRRILVARFALKEVKCNCMRLCCRGYTWNGRWLIEVAWISATVFMDLKAPLLRGKDAVRDKLCMRYFGRRDETMQTLANAAGVHLNTLSEYNNQLVTTLKGEERRAYDGITERLKTAELIAD